jgi:ATP-dependent DNA helicase RecG
MNLDSPLTSIKGVGTELAAKYKTLGLETVADLINHLPSRYEDYSNVLEIKNIKPGSVTIKAVIKQVSGRYVRRGLHITEAVASDDSSSVKLVWFNQPYRAGSFKAQTEYFISGQFELGNRSFSIMNPSMELVSDFPINTARIVPIYRLTKGLTSFQIRKSLREVLPVIRQVPETLPQWLLSEEGLSPRSEALESIHFPLNQEDLDKAKQRLGFEEVFSLSLASLLNKYENDSESTITIPFNEEAAKKFVGELPFKLTDAQRKVIWKICLDLARGIPMNRIVEGDVGSGKTVVATMAALMVVVAGYQVAIMAPTELLARQHYETLQSLLKPLGLDKGVGLLVGGQKTLARSQILESIASGDTKFIIGTHALIQEKVDMKNLALVIIDEQHRFGVEQRKTLMAKAGHMPHVLSLTATPIPRSLALTLYGELDLSLLDTKPEGRKPIITKIVSPNSIAQTYEEVKKQLDMGKQMFVVCPVINESTRSAKSVNQVYDELRQKYFKEYRVGLLHGKMPGAEKNDIMKKFVDHEIDILVSTTVVEVGVDVPNATVMLIESADNYGLAQIHQLRGRVGRDGSQGYCYLVLSSSAAPTKRLRALESNDDGFKLAEIDLALRGPGAIYGAVQHGSLDLRIAQLSDLGLINSARKAAEQFIYNKESLLKYTELAKTVNVLRSITNLN